MTQTIKTFSVSGVARLQEVLVCVSEYDGDECVSWTQYRVDASDQHGTVEDIVEYETNKWLDRGYTREYSYAAACLKRAQEVRIRI